MITVDRALVVCVCVVLLHHLSSYAFILRLSFLMCMPFVMQILLRVSATVAYHDNLSVARADLISAVLSKAYRTTHVCHHRISLIPWCRVAFSSAMPAPRPLASEVRACCGYH